MIENPQVRTMGMLCHLLALFSGFIGPLVIWLVKKEEDPFIDECGKESLNFQITVMIALFICLVLWCVLIGLFLLPVVLIGDFVFVIIASVKTNQGEMYRYPLNIRIIK